MNVRVIHPRRSADRYMTDIDLKGVRIVEWSLEEQAHCLYLQQIVIFLTSRWHILLYFVALNFW